MSLDELPSSIDFHLPGGYNTNIPVELHLYDERKLHRQLVCWCLVQRYWYYVLHTPQVSDGEYDEIENAIQELEDQCEYLKDENKYSPVSRLGSSRKEDYPKLIRGMFNAVQ